MIRKLRQKFVCIIMALISAVLLIVFSAICLSSYGQQQAEAYDAMRLELNRQPGMQPPRFEIGKKMPPNKPVSLLPVFSVLLDPQGGIGFIESGNVQIDEDIVAQAVSMVQAQPKNDGVLPSLNIRFMREETPHGIKIAFLDQSFEQASLVRFILTLLLVGVGGLAAFFFMSLYLANWALRPVEKAWTQQQEFVANASHELKTPLTVILANLNILQQHSKESIDAQQKWIDNTQAEASRMKTLVDDLLFLAKTDAAQRSQERTSFSLSDAAWNCFLPFEPLAYEQRITLTSTIQSDLRMHGHEPEIKQLMVILLDNACKYAGEKGSVFLHVSSSQDKVRIKVQNTGAPILPEQLPHIFERFYRTDKARARTQGGYGLGLSIAAQIVQAHNGKISVSSDCTQGTIMDVVLPRE